MNTIQNRYTTIYTESNPNPNSLKFVVNYMLVPDSITFDFPDVESAKAGSPLAEELFAYDFVKRVFVMSNFITITKDEDTSWHEVAPQLKKHLQDYLEQNKPLLKEKIAVETFDENEPEIDRKIKSILEEYIKPAVEMDGGAITFHSYHEGIVKVMLQGACSGCPSSMLTLKAGIENLLKRMLPEVTEVVAEEI
jgi:NFU1 iron-sulfur cluster scaffold homolog, mitochondrial